MGKWVRLVTWVLMIVSLGMRTSRLSKVRSLTESRSMERTSPAVSPTLMMSPTTKGCSAIRNSPLIRLEAEVCEAKPRATVRMPAAPSSTLRLTPSTRRVQVTAITASR